MSKKDGRPLVIWRLLDVLKESTSFLEGHGIEDARVNSERLIAHVLDMSRMELYLAFDRPLTERERDSIRSGLKRRAKHEPLQYIIGSTEFMNHSFRVTPDVLIPRPETEILVEQAAEAALRRLGGSSASGTGTVKDSRIEVQRTGEETGESRNAGTFRILDVGVGSGNITVSLAALLPGAEITGTDVSHAALEIAAENIRCNGVGERVHLVRTDCFDLSFVRDVSPPFDMVVSNPPYVSKEDWETLAPEIRLYEPKTALSEGGDGLAFYRVLAGKAKSLLRDKGDLFFEVGDGQSDEVSRILSEQGFGTINVYMDLNRIPRVVRGRL